LSWQGHGEIGRIDCFLVKGRCLGERKVTSWWRGKVVTYGVKKKKNMRGGPSKGQIRRIKEFSRERSKGIREKKKKRGGCEIEKGKWRGRD